MSENIRMLVLSDLHASDQDPSSHLSPSYVSTQGVGPRGGIEPIADMVRAVKETIGSVDFIICPGDMAHQALPSALTYVAEKLEKATAALSANKLLIVAGNHDVDSRYKHNQYDPRGHLMTTYPNMPFNEHVHHLEFFANHVTMNSFGNVRVLAVDSTAFHGGGATKKGDGSPEIPEYEHGRVSPIMLSRIQGLLEADTKRYKVNLLLCHHHPQNNNTPHEQDFSQMDGGPALIHLLDSGGFGRWLIIHGHKHRPRLCYASGGGASPVMLGAASFSFQVGGDALNQSPNQFHVVTIKPDLAEQLQGGLAGSVESWSWVVGDGWRPAATNAHGLPAYAGFGFRGDPEALAPQLAKVVAVHGTMEWSSAVAAYPALGALLPSDFGALKRAAESLDLTILFDERARPVQVGLKS